MNILWISWKDPYHPTAGGAEIYSKKIAQELVSRGHTVTWMSLGVKNIPKNETRDGIHYYRILHKKYYYTGLFHLMCAIEYTKKFKNMYDCIVEEIHGPPLGTPLYVRKKNIIVIHEVAGEIWQKMVPFPLGIIGRYIIEPILFQFYKRSQFITVSESTQKELISLGIKQENIHIIYNGFDTPQQVNVKKSIKPICVYISEIRPIKGCERVCAAFMEIQQNIPDALLEVIGDNNSAYGKKVTKKYQSESILFLGKINEKEKYKRLARARLLLHGSFKEGWGRVIIEANSVGTPAVVFDAAGLRDSVRHNETGYIAKSSDEFVRYVIHILTDDNAYQKMQANALQWSKKFTWQKTTEKACEIIEK